jgi:dihydrodipicolinate synthase/N-acetylneuraminate lyase
VIELRGIVPALTTPYSDGEVTLSALRRNIGRYERLALAGYLVLGSTGEAVLLDPDERRRLLEAARAAVPSGKLLVAGVAAEATATRFGSSRWPRISARTRPCCRHRTISARR